ncbi:hypothetical protein JZ751_002999 [Albula glossodonta]|uniref:Uncharacterized protein n=1 Tax=Albula glossodonta TaxID=121402 RepID=A0A8T2NG28_9TELE|nr:hypothetical protein JZ751_002999 [Albula glossodonta]
MKGEKTSRTYLQSDGWMMQAVIASRRNHQGTEACVYHGPSKELKCSSSPLCIFDRGWLFCPCYIHGCFSGGTGPIRGGVLSPEQRSKTRPPAPLDDPRPDLAPCRQVDIQTEQGEILSLIKHSETRNFVTQYKPQNRRPPDSFN